MSKPTLAEWLAGVKERCEKAAKGPWYWFQGQLCHGKPGVRERVTHLAPFLRDEDAVFCAHSRTDVEALVGMMEAWFDFWASCGKPNGRSQHLEFGIADAVGFKAKLEALIPEENP